MHRDLHDGHLYVCGDVASGEIAIQQSDCDPADCDRCEWKILNHDLSIKLAT